MPANLHQQQTTGCAYQHRSQIQRKSRFNFTDLEGEVPFWICLGANWTGRVSQCLSRRLEYSFFWQSEFSCYFNTTQTPSNPIHPNDRAHSIWFDPKTKIAFHSIGGKLLLHFGIFHQTKVYNTLHRQCQVVRPYVSVLVLWILDFASRTLTWHSIPHKTFVHRTHDFIASASTKVKVWLFQFTNDTCALCPLLVHRYWRIRLI